MRTIDSSKQVKIGAIISYIAIAFNILSGLLYTPWMLKHIGQSDYGLYSTAVAFLSYFTIDLGLGSAISRFIAKYRAEKNEAAVERLLGVVYKIYLALDVIFLICVIVVFSLIEQIFWKFTPVEIEKFRIIFLVMGAFTLISFPCSTFSGILIAYERFFAQKICDLSSKVLIVVCMVIALSMGQGLYALVLVNVLVHLFMHIVRFVYLKKSIHIHIAWKCFDKALIKEIFSFSAWVLVITIAERFIFNIEPTLIGALSGTVAVSIFAAGNTIEGYIWTFANALNSLFLPKVSRLVATDGADRTKINALMVRVGRVQMIIIGAIVFIFVSMGYEFIDLWLPENYQSAYYVALLMILPSLVLRTQDIASTLTWAENKLKARSFMYILNAVISVALSVILVPRLHALGAGVAIFVGTVFAQIIGMHFIYTRVMHLDMWELYKNCQSKMIIPGLICMVVGFVLQRYIPSPNLLHFVLKACVAGVVYIVAIWFMYMNAGEKELFTGALEKIRNKLIKK